MPIAATLEPHFRLTYQNNVTMAAQQMKNPLMDAVTRVQGVGEAMSASDILAAVEYQRAEERSRVNVENMPVGSRRWLLRTAEIESGQTIDIEDKLDMARDPTSDLVQAHTRAVNRGMMDLTVGVRKDIATGGYIVTDGGLLGNAIEGKRPGTSGVALPAGQIIPVAGSGLTLDKLRSTVLTLNQADFGIEDDDPLYALISPKQKDDLLAIAAASGPALNSFSIDQLISGKPSKLMGISWILSNRVPKDASGNWLIPVWSKRNVVLGVWEDIQGDIWRNGAAKNKPVVRVWARADCVRLQDKGVVAITCAA